MLSALTVFQSCSNVECWTLKCNVGVLEKGTSAILQVRSRIWGETFNTVSFSNYMQKRVCSHYEHVLNPFIYHSYNSVSINIFNITSASSFHKLNVSVNHDLQFCIVGMFLFGKCGGKITSLTSNINLLVCGCSLEEVSCYL